MKLNRILAILIRNLYEIKHSPARTIDIIFWPVLELMVWGYMTVYLVKTSTALSPIASVLIGAIILWSLYFRIQQDISFSFVLELWDRNLLNLFASPLKFKEYFASTMLLGLIKVTASALVMTLSAYLLYQYNFFSAGPVLFLLFFNLLLFGWVVGIIAVTTVMRFGSRADVMAWWIAFALQPLSAVTFPISILPPWMQKVSSAIPLSHVFEGLREVFIKHSLPSQSLITASLLNLIYLLLVMLLFHWVHQIVREKGLLGKLT